MEKKVTKITLSTFLLILAIIVIIVMGIFLIKLYKDKTTANNESTELKSQVNNLNGTVSNLQEKINKVSEVVNEKNQANNNTNQVTYEINVTDESRATIKATANGKTITQEIEMYDTIDKTGSAEFPNLGTVALVSTSGGEGCFVEIFQLVNNEIKLIGTIDCGADMVQDATYTVTTKNDNIAIINAKRDSENTTQEFKMSSSIVNTSVVDILNYGKVVLVIESNENNYKIQAYRLSQDYITGQTEGIRNVGLDVKAE